MRTYGAVVTISLLALVGGFHVRNIAAQSRPAAAAANVDNVRAQVASDGSVTINYDLVASDSSAKFAVSLSVSVDGGKSFSLQPGKVYGDVGAAVSPGVDRTITWNPETDGYTVRIGSGALGLTEVPPDRLRYRVTTTGGRAGTSSTPGAKPATPSAKPATPSAPAPTTPPPAARPAVPAASPEPSSATPAAEGAARIGTLRVITNPAGATVHVDDQESGVTPFSGSLSAGRHIVRVVSAGYKDETREILIRTNDNTSLNMRLSATAPSTTAARPATPSAPAPATAPAQTAAKGKGVNKLVWVGLAGAAAAGGGLALAGGGSKETILPPPPPPPVSCAFSLSSSTLPAFGTSGGTTGVNVAVSPSGCVNPSWSTSNGNTWISLSPSSGSGNGAVSVTAAANTTTSARSGTLTIAGKTVSVSQSGIACSYTGNFIGGDGVPANSRNTQIPGDCINCGLRGITITASSSTCQWSVSGNPSWFQPMNGVFTRTGSATFTMWGTERNFTNADRNASFTVAGLAFTVRQCRVNC